MMFIDVRKKENRHIFFTVPLRISRNNKVPQL